MRKYAIPILLVLLIGLSGCAANQATVARTIGAVANANDIYVQGIIDLEQSGVITREQAEPLVSVGEQIALRGRTANTLAQQLPDSQGDLLIEISQILSIVQQEAARLENEGIPGAGVIRSTLVSIQAALEAAEVLLRGN